MIFLIIFILVQFSSFIHTSYGQTFPFYGLNLTDFTPTFDANRENDLIFNYNSSNRYFHSDAKSWFGYSISGYSREGKSFCIVGTPKYFDDELGEYTGRVYRIELDYKYPGCSIMPIPNNDEERRIHRNTPYPAKSMFIGGSVSAFANDNNEVQLACDPRFLYMPYYSNESTKFNQIIGTGHCVVYTGMSLDYLSLDSCASHEEGSCLSGFSSSIQAGNKRGESFLALGLPGSYLTEGNVYFARYQNKKLISSSRLKTSPVDLKHVGYNLGYDVKIAQLNRIQSTRPDLGSFDYDLDTNNKYHIVTSAKSWSRFEYRDIVMIINQAMDIDGIKYIQDRWGHVGNYFGYSLEILDMDGNGIADIVVSSPYYSEKRDESQPDSSLKPDIGRVYIFYGNNETDTSSFSYDTDNPVILKGLKMKWGRFGHSIANLGDIDGDGTEDLAVSCPFCKLTQESENSGAVFIYFGRNGLRIEDEPMQIIFSDNIPKTEPLYQCEFSFDEPDTHRNFKSFGWSLSSGVDIDLNESPDLLVGDYDSGQIIALKSRSFLWFEDPIWKMNQTEFIKWTSGDDSYCNDEKCRYKVELSVLVRGRKSFIANNVLSLLVTMDLDSLIDSEKRIGDSSELSPLGGPSIIQRKVFLNKLSENNNRVTIFNLIFEPKIRSVRMNNWMPIVMNATIEPLVTNDENPEWSMHPYLGERSFVNDPLYFTNKDCGPDQVCHCDLQIKLIESSPNKDENVIYYRERITQRNVTFGLANFGENAYQAELRVLIPKQFSYTPPTELNCLIDENDDSPDHVLLKCSLGDPLRNTGLRFRPFTFNLNTASAFSLNDGEKRQNQTLSNGVESKFFPDELNISAYLSSGNLDKDPTNNRVNLTYKLRLYAKVQLSSSSQESATMDRRNFSRLITSMQKIEPNYIGPQIKHTYLLTNEGPSPIENLQINLSIPIMTADRENLLYILDRIRYQDMEGGPAVTIDTLPNVISSDANFNGSCFIPDEFVNPLKLQAVDKANTERLKKINRFPRSLESNREFYSDDPFEIDGQVNDGKRRSERQSDQVNSFMGSILANSRTKQQEIIRCGHDFANLGKPICANIVCFINKLNSRDAVRINLRAWVWSDTLFRHKISDIGVITEAKCQLPEKAFNINVYGSREVAPLAIGQSFVFEGIKSLITNDIPIWPIILGILVGATLLTCIIIGMWKCGFFKRKRWYDHSDMQNASSVLDSSKMVHL